MHAQLLQTVLGVTLSCLLLAGCKSKGMDTPPDPGRDSVRTTERRMATVQDYANEIRLAKDGPTEAVALEQFRTWAAQQGYTYVVKALRSNGPGEVPNPTGYADPIKVQVDVFQAQRVLHTFTFIPKDNRNIGIIAAG